MEAARKEYEEAVKIYRELAEKNPENYLPEVSRQITCYLLRLCSGKWREKRIIHSMTACDVAKECLRISPFLFLLLLGLVGCGKKMRNARKPPG